MVTFTAQPKKFIALCILDILKKYTDENHTLTQKQIEEKLENEYQMKVDRKSVKSNLEDLIDFGIDIMSDEVTRIGKDRKTGEPQEQIIKTNIYWQNDFSDEELRLIIDSILFSKHIPKKQCSQLIEKLEGLSNVYFKSKVKHVNKTPEDRTDNKQIFYNISILDEAISNNRKVSFKYLHYDICKKTHIKTDKDGEDKIYVISPYQMAAKDGKYYLICNYDKYDDVSNYRIDRIYDIQILEEKRKPFNKLSGANGRELNLEEYMQEHVYMYSSDKVKGKLIIEPRFVDDIIDVFGKDVLFKGREDGRIEVVVNASKDAIILFAKSLMPWVVIEGPESLKREIVRDIKDALKNY